MLFPTPAQSEDTVTALVIDDAQHPDRLPVVRWAGTSAAARMQRRASLRSWASTRGCQRWSSMPTARIERPGLRGHRLSDPGGGPRDIAGRAWSTAFSPVRVEQDATTLVVVEAQDDRQRSCAAHRGRVAARWRAAGPTPADQHRSDAVPRRRARGRRCRVPTGCHRVARLHRAPRARAHAAAARRSPTGCGCASHAAAGPASTPPRCSSRAPPASVLDARRGAAACTSPGAATRVLARRARRGGGHRRIGGGELLLPGEVVLDGRRELHDAVGASSPPPSTGSTGSQPALHAWQRSLPAHPAEQPVIAQRLGGRATSTTTSTGSQRIADRAARVGRRAVRARRRLVPRPPRRHRRPRRLVGRRRRVARRPRPARSTTCAGSAWSSGSGSSPRWSTPTPTCPRAPRVDPRPPGDRVPLLHRHQQVLDLTRPEVCELPARPGRRGPVRAPDRLREVGPQPRPARGRQRRARRRARRCTRRPLAFYRAARRPARPRTRRSTGSRAPSGGGRIDLGVLERVQRVWTSDMTDALARQQIQRWTEPARRAGVPRRPRLARPPRTQTGRTLRLDFRAATALFGSLRHRVGPHRGRPTRSSTSWPPGARCTSSCGRCCTAGRRSAPDAADPAVLAHGVVAADRTGPARATSSSTSPSTTAGARFGCPGCTQRVSTKPGGSVRWTTGHCPPAHRWTRAGPPRASLSPAASSPMWACGCHAGRQKPPSSSSSYAATARTRTRTRSSNRKGRTGRRTGSAAGLNPVARGRRGGEG